MRAPYVSALVFVASMAMPALGQAPGAPTLPNATGAGVTRSFERPPKAVIDGLKSCLCRPDPGVFGEQPGGYMFCSPIDEPVLDRVFDIPEWGSDTEHATTWARVTKADSGVNVTIGVLLTRGDNPVSPKGHFYKSNCTKQVQRAWACLDETLAH